MTYGRLSGRACRLHTAARHAHGQSSQEEVEKLHDAGKLGWLKFFLVGDELY